MIRSSSHPAWVAALVPACVALALSGLAQAQSRTAKRGNPEYRCTIRHQIGSNLFSVIQRVDTAGAPLGAAEVQDNGKTDAEAAAIIDQLYKLLPEIAKHPAANCHRDGSREPEARWIEFECTERWTADGFDYRIDPHGMQVNRRLPSGMAFSINWSVPRPDASGDHFDGSMGGRLSNPASGPGLFFTMPAPWGSENRGVRVARKKVEWTYRQGGEVRVGRRVFRDWSSSNALLFLRQDMLSQLLLDPGDIQVTATDTAKGVVAREILPRTLMTDIEAQVQLGYGRLHEKQRDPVAKCVRHVQELGPEIVVT